MSKDTIPARVAVDANFLVALVDPHLSGDRKTRLDHFIARMEKAKALVIIPMPALAEFLVRADTAGIDILNKLERKSYVLAAPFDRAAAFECAQLDRAALGAGMSGAVGGNGSEPTKGAKKDGVDAPWQKIKIDRQVVAIAKAKGAAWVISADDGVRSNALRVGMLAFTIDELELPASALQAPLPFTAIPAQADRNL